MKKSIDIVIPVKNEEKNVAELSKQIHAAFSQINVDYNMIFVVDLSTDNTIKILRELSEIYPITIHKKEGKPGKGYSIIEGTQLADADIVAFIDGDLQYPPEIIPQMLEMLIAEELGVVVANRKTHKSPFLRKFGSKVNRLLFGKLILGLDCDVQSGLKVFRKEIFHYVDLNDIGPWTVDMPLLHTATELGHKIGQVDISFEDRKGGQSKVSFIKTGWTIAKCAINLKLKEKRVYNHDQNIDPTNDTPINKGITYKRNKFVPHTFLPYHKTSLYTFHKWQKAAIGLGIALFTGSLFINPIFTGVTTVAILSTIYFADVVFTLFLTIKSLNKPPEIKITEWELKNLDNHSLPVYSVMCPLYKEAEVLGHFIENIQKMDWPKDKLDVMLLLEENDLETQEAAANMEMPSYVRVLVVPNSQPKTKPKACNYGLHHAYGEYVVIYDAEDKPDPQQLKKAYLAFNKVPKNVLCIQGKLNYYNPHQNLLTTLFTAEYSLWFDIILPGLQSIYTTIPLGGTSNHFRTKELIRLHAWDPFNVTEDCDLGVRLFKDGFKTAIIDSTTWEEANSNVKNWIRQRSRWIKGYFQTYLVHMRNPIEFFKQHKWHALIFQLIIGLRISFILINPILWISTLSYFVLYKYVGLAIESLYPNVVFYMAAFSLVFGNFLYLYNYMIGLAKKEHWGVIKYVFFVPFYWMLMSIAAVMAFWQLLVKPHYWEKTKHGLHIKNASKDKKRLGISLPSIKKPQFAIPILDVIHNYYKSFKDYGISEGTVLIFATIAANFFNYLYNAYLSRKLSLEDFGTIGLVGSFVFLASIPLQALTRTVAYKSGIYFGKHKRVIAPFWIRYRKVSFYLGTLLSVIWIAFIPFMQGFFNVESYLPLLLITPIWFVGILYAVDYGFLEGSLKFRILGLLLLTEGLSKFIFSWIFVNLGQSNMVYASIPLSAVFALILSYVYAKRLIRNYGSDEISVKREELSFPGTFFSSSVLIKFSAVAFLSFDIILAKHFMSTTNAGAYALISLIGKMIFFANGLFGQFIISMISNDVGAKRESKSTFYRLLAISTTLCGISYAILGLFGNITAPFLVGPKIEPYTDLLVIYGLGMFLFSVAYNIITYNQILDRYVYSIVSFFISIIEIIGFYLVHHSLEQVVILMAIIGGLNFLISIILFSLGDKILTIERNIIEFFGVFTKSPLPDIKDINGKPKVLIFNWRDTKHIWGGGAEVYIHEIAKKLVENGHFVTVFCGNDNKNIPYEVIDNVHILRKGGFFTVYIWAAIYYLLKLKGKFDVVIDSENGIPFFTPLYVSEPVIGLIHHVHQDIILNELKIAAHLKPAAFLAKFLETKAMPYIYRNTTMVTVSNSTKSDMEKLGFGNTKEIEIVHPGIEPNKFKSRKKTKHPSVLYLGRLKPYKSIDTAIKAMQSLVVTNPDIKLQIAGFGESRESLEKLTKKLRLQNSVEFLGKVTEEEKIKLMSESWVFVYPSSWEGWGISVVEANASGTPVVASNVQGLRDSVKNPHSGYLVEPHKPDKFAEKISLIINDHEHRKSLSKSSKEWALNFTWDKSAEKLINIINRLI